MKRYFAIGALKISLEYGPKGQDISTDQVFEEFSCAAFENPDICFKIDTTSPLPSLDSHRRIFTSIPQGLWTIFEDSGKSHYLIALQDIARENEPYRIISADRRFSDFIIYTRPSPEGLLFPLEYPLADLAFSGHININKIGIILHSACVSVQGKGYLFAGVSGAGKSTISEIWQKDREAEVLTDERLIIREYQGDFCAFGTPWHGTSEIHSNMGAPIKKIFFIKHGKENRALPISQSDAASRLMVRCFPTFWHSEGMQFAVDFCAKVAEAKESYELEFVNDASVVEYVKKLDG